MVAGLPQPTCRCHRRDLAEPQPNAFATGRNRTRGGVRHQGSADLAAREVEGVMAHEMMRASPRHPHRSVAAAMLRHLLPRPDGDVSTIFGGRDDREWQRLELRPRPDRRRLMQMAVSRREFEADRGPPSCSAPGPLARALQNIEVVAKQRPMQVPRSRRSLDPQPARRQLGLIWRGVLDHRRRRHPSSASMELSA